MREVASRRRAAWLFVALILALAVGAATVHWLPELVRRATVARVHALTGRPVSIDAVDVSLWSGRFTVRGFRLGERAGGDGESAVSARPAAQFDRLDVGLRLPWLLLGRVHIRDLTIAGSTVRVIRLPGGEFNFSDLLRSEGPAGEPRALLIERLAVRGGTVVLEDRALPEPRTWTTERLEIDAANLSTRSGGGTASARSVTAGAPVALELRQVRLYPIHLEGTIRSDELDLALAGVYLPPSAPFALASGRVSTSVTVALDARDGLRADATGRVQDAVMTEPGGGVLARVPELTARIRDLAFRDGALRVGALAAEGAMSVRDPTAGPSAPLRPSRVRANVDDLTWPATTPGRVDVESSIPGGGTLAVVGTLRPPPEPSQIRARVTDLNLAPWAHLLPADLRAGGAHVTGLGQADLRIDEPLTAGVPARIQGTVAVTRVGVADARRQHLTAERIEASGLVLDWPRRVAVERVLLTAPRVAMERDKTGRLSVADLLAVASPPARPASVPAGTASPAPGSTGPARSAHPPAPRGPGLAVTVGEIVVRDGALAWRDDAVAPAARLSVSAVNAAIAGVGAPLRGPLDLRADLRAPGGGQLRVSGRVNLEPLGAELRVAARNAALEPYQPYLATPARLTGTADLDIALAVPSLAERRATVRGTAALAGIDVRDGERSVLRVERGAATGIDVAWPERVDIARLALTAPWVLAERDEKGVLTIRPLLTPRWGPTQPTPAPATAAATADRPPAAPATAAPTTAASATAARATPAPPATASVPATAAGPATAAAPATAPRPATARVATATTAASSATAASSSKPRPPDIAPDGAQPDAAPADTAADAAPIAVNVARLTVERGGMRIVDRAVVPAFAVDLRSATMRVDGFSTARVKPARVELTGELGASTQVSLAGTVRAFGDRPLLVDLQGEMRGFSAPRANPYVVEHSGWKIREGSVTSKLRVHVDGDALSARTDLRVSQLHLVKAEARDETQTRIGLPLGTLTSLMKNSRGDIELSIPVGGRLTDPRFDFSEAIWRAVRTVAVNAIALPVSWIGRIRYTRDARIEAIEIDPIPFPAGAPALTDEARERLERIAAFLHERPEVRLALTGVVSARDVEALRRPALDAAIERAARDGRLSREAAAARLFERRFPGRPVPATQEEILAALSEQDGKAGELADLGDKRVTAVRSALKRSGVDSARLAERPVAQRGSADGQVAIEIAEGEAAKSSGMRGLLERLGVPLRGAREGQ